MLAAVILPAEPRAEWARRRRCSPTGPAFLEHLLEVIVHPQSGVRRVVLGADAEPSQKRFTSKATKLLSCGMEKAIDLHPGSAEQLAAGTEESCSA